MSTDLEKVSIAPAIEKALIMGDLNSMNAEQRVSFYRAVCSSVGLNPLTRPFEYIVLNNKLTLYARKDATDQLRRIHNVRATILSRELMDDAYVVTVRVETPDGRSDEAIGAVMIAGLKGEAKCNAMMKAETKAKRRATLSICGLGVLDETEAEPRPRRRQFHYADDLPKQVTAATDEELAEIVDSGLPAVVETAKGVFEPPPDPIAIMSSIEHAQTLESLAAIAVTVKASSMSADDKDTARKLYVVRKKQLSKSPASAGADVAVGKGTASPAGDTIDGGGTQHEIFI